MQVGIVSANTETKVQRAKYYFEVKMNLKKKKYNAKGNEKR